MKELDRAKDSTDAPSVRPVRAAVFRQLKRADRAVGELVREGFSKDHITVICPASIGERFDEYQRKEPAGSHTPGATLGGSAIGAALGGLVAIGGAGLLVAGPLLASMGALAGGFIGAMLSRGVEPEAANFYDQALRKGDILVAVECDAGPDQAARLKAAERVLAQSGSEPLALTEG